MATTTKAAPAPSADDMLRAIHASDPKTASNRYNPQQLAAAYAAIQKKPATGGKTPPTTATPPPTDTPTGGGNGVPAPAPGVQGDALSGLADAIAKMGQQGPLTGTNPNETGATGDAISAAYSQLTKHTDTDQASAQNDLTQQLANEGIQYSDDPNSQYQKRSKDLTNQYDDIRSNAQQQAVTTGDNEYNNLYANQISGAASTTNNASTLSTIQNTLAGQGFTQQQIDEVFKQLKINQQNANTAATSANRSGGGSSSAGSTTVTPVDNPFAAS